MLNHVLGRLLVVKTHGKRKEHFIDACLFELLIDLSSWWHFSIQAVDHGTIATVQSSSMA